MDIEMPAVMDTAPNPVPATEEIVREWDGCHRVFRTLASGSKSFVLVELEQAYEPFLGACTLASFPSL
ncbi:hypothetical protein KSP40_PGU019831 [Platanthera guangdongensis]|uniref:Uncharacterized protein n=1 Tax=Platanthera guangdongensis TaxID=2320717 RepID=A0ABR2N1Q5_9ASPA